MNIELVLEQLDSLFAEHKINEVEGFLLGKLEEANKEGDRGAIITLMNEIIGHYREMSEFDKSVEYCNDVLLLMQKLGMEGTTAYATTLLNVANAYRAAGLLRESMAAYQAVKVFYEKNLGYDDIRYAGLYNNMSLLFQEMADFESACDCLERALSIVIQFTDARIETAVTYTNLAASQLKLGRYEEAVANLNRAFYLFEKDAERDYHYSGALSAMGEAQYLMGNFEESERYYKLALAEIEKNVGRNKAYEITLQNLNLVTMRKNHPEEAEQETKTAEAAEESPAEEEPSAEKMEQWLRATPTEMPAENKTFKNGLELCEDFYREFGIPMIRSRFPLYESMIAVGLVGEGSDCFGFDDEVSRDHDFGPGFCMWLTDQVYDEIGEELQRAYEELPSTYMGITRVTTAKAQKRVGVFRISDFYESLIGLTDVPTTQNQWLFLDDYRLAAATNGKVFRDDLGEFTRIRRGILAYYPEEVRIKKIAREATLMAQAGQYNYLRMFGRGETVTAQIALSEFLKHTMAMIYLLNRRYAPFYKWMHKGMENLAILGEIRDLLTALAGMPVGDEKIPPTIEIIVAIIIAEMKKQGLTTGDDNYLDHHTEQILHSISEKVCEETCEECEQNSEPIQSLQEQNGKQEPSPKAILIQELVSLEWEAFDKVKNEGGRASCQDDWNTFSIMRTSQYYTWPEEILQSYIDDFRAANEKGWNLIMEKYARMMESTVPMEYEQIKNSLPEISEAKRKVIETIVKIQVTWMECFAIMYPKSAGRARTIHTYEDTPYHTSYETYLRGELSTYSDATLDMYGNFVYDLCKKEKNLAEMIMRNTAILYGYESLEDLESKI